MVDRKVLSDRAKAATKTALAMMLAYGIALSMNWDNPYWAGFAVAFCSLSTGCRRNVCWNLAVARSPIT